MGIKGKIFSRFVGALAPAVLPALDGQSRLLILNYHRVHEGGKDFPLDQDVISASPELFEREVVFCKKHFNLLTFAQLKEALDGKRAMPRRPLIITFDDGYEDNYRLAYPILRKHDAVATFFVATAYIGQPRLFWWDEAAYCFQRTEQENLQIELAGTGHNFILGTAEYRRDALRIFLKLVKTVPDPERIAAIEQLKQLAGVSFADSVLGRQMMTWDEIKEMADAGMEIGSHSQTHPVLAKISDAQHLRREILGSKAEIEEHLGRSVKAFSYPVGGSGAVNAQVRDLVASSGYSFAVTYQNGVNSLTPADPFMLRRLHVDGLTFDGFKTQLVLPRK